MTEPEIRMHNAESKLDSVEIMYKAELNFVKHEHELELGRIKMLLGLSVVGHGFFIGTVIIIIFRLSGGS